MAPQVSIIILNFNGWKDTVECLESVYNLDYPNFYIIVVDNGSEDDSLSYIKDYLRGDMPIKSSFFEYDSKNKPLSFEEFEEDSNLPYKNSKLTLIKNHVNKGFAEGNNIGIRFALENQNPEYVLLLNNDTVVEENLLKNLIQAGESNSKIGVVGPKVYSYENPHILGVSGGYINFYLGRVNYPGYKEEDHGQLDQEEFFDYISGCALMIKKETIAKVGLLNPYYFLYFEDVEYCLRIQKKGFKIVLATSAMIWHKTSETSTSYRVYYLIRNRFWLIREYGNSLQYKVFVILFFLTYFWFHTLRHLIYYQDTKRLICFYKGVRDGLR